MTFFTNSKIILILMISPSLLPNFKSIIKQSDLQYSTKKIAHLKKIHLEINYNHHN
jgi:hypothetical protein